jgi:hypothetical protein
MRFYVMMAGFALLGLWTVGFAMADDLPMATGLGLVTIGYAIMTLHGSSDE